MIFGFLERRRKRTAIADIELTLSNTFAKLAAASEMDTPLEQQFAVAGALASCLAALRDVYPKFLVIEDSISVAFIEANASRPMSEAQQLCDAIIKLVRTCPNDRREQIATVLWMLSPTRGHQARNGLFVT